MQTAHGAPNPVASVIGRTHNSKQTSDFSQCKALHNSGIGLRTACAHNCSTVWLHPRVIIMLVVGRVSVPLASVVVVLVVLAGITFNLQPVSAGPWRRNGNALPRRVAESDEYLEFGRKLKQSCGYESCPKPKKNMLNVHLVPHTHDDVGWLKTVDQYYYGSKTTIQKAGVQYILDSVIQSLLSDPERKFIYVESAFFFKWYDEQTAELQQQVRMLVNEGRLEFIGGAWSMNDEAAAHYHSIVDQFTWGLAKLNDTFGECGRPRIGWQIDPFGHSREQASLFAQMGYDGLFFGRLDYQDKRERMTHKRAEMIWKTSDNLADGDLFTGVLYNLYQAPPGFCFDILCSDEPFMDSPYSAENNVKAKVEKFLYYVNLQAESYRTNNILLTMGGDFTYMDANVYFKNMDKLIKYTNALQSNGSNVNVFYSTPSCYLKALHDVGITWPTKSDDFFPYASDPHSFWTGYYTSRPTSKRFERVGNHFLQVCKQLTALAPSRQTHMEPHLNMLREAMGVMQHHDAITGTEKQHVANDYARMLNRAVRACGANTKAALNQIVDPKYKRSVRSGGLPFEHPTTDYPQYTFAFESCHLLNVSKCELTETKDSFTVTLYNPLAHAGHEYVRLPVTGGRYIVRDYRNVEVSSQIVPIPQSVLNLSYRFSNATSELVFLANELPPLGFKSYFVTRAIDSLDDFLHEAPAPASPPSADQTLAKQQETAQWHSQEVTIGNKYLNVSFDSNGFLSTITIDGVTNRLRQTFIYYEGALGNNEEFRNRSSGAYIFRPNGTEKTVTENVQLKVVKGGTVQEVHQVFSEWISQVVRVYADESHVEFEWMVGPIPVEDGVGKEIVSRFYTAAQSSGVFWTDANGREMMRRVRNHRDTWNVDLEEKISGNYYPVTAKIALEDENLRLAVLNDRAQGGSSLEDGSLELMVHRRLLHDDAFGVEEALNEKAFGQGLVARGKHWVVFGAKKPTSPTPEARERFLQNRVLLPNWLFFSDVGEVKYEDWQKQYTNIYSALSLSLPLNVHLLTFEPWKENSILVRFEHLLEKGEDPMYSKPVRFNIQDVFRQFSIEEVREMTLAANQLREDSTRLKFKPDPSYIMYSSIKRDVSTPLPSPSPPNVVAGRSPLMDELSRNVADDGFEIMLKPMEIRTFVFQLEYKP
ncbi:lysosomal alpha-mannosidase [Anopheles gambiae]|uniref:lysosomal alpha-mannosidase n=1 Tax=Anopheles gambiae TaxID=7165 RepID=UPI002AC89FF4|nr:lysosomal alpha-mannosidase [Anopheles gambiae]